MPAALTNGMGRGNKKDGSRKQVSEGVEMKFKIPPERLFYKTIQAFLAKSEIKWKQSQLRFRAIKHNIGKEPLDGVSHALGFSPSVAEPQFLYLQRERHVYCSVLKQKVHQSRHLPTPSTTILFDLGSYLFNPPEYLRCIL